MVGGYCQISDELSEKITPLIPEHKTHHPLGSSCFSSKLSSFLQFSNMNGYAVLFSGSKYTSSI
ncbi:Uncharacterised protein [Providencia rustigianii]|nr:Uncharacterised protein [Providencia rustigianii]